MRSFLASKRDIEVAASPRQQRRERPVAFFWYQMLNIFSPVETGDATEKQHNFRSFSWLNEDEDEESEIFRVYKSREFLGQNVMVKIASDRFGFEDAHRVMRSYSHTLYYTSLGLGWCLSMHIIMHTYDHINDKHKVRYTVYRTSVSKRTCKAFYCVSFPSFRSNSQPFFQQTGTF